MLHSALYLEATNLPVLYPSLPSELAANGVPVRSLCHHLARIAGHRVPSRCWNVANVRVDCIREGHALIDINSSVNRLRGVREV